MLKKDCLCELIPFFAVKRRNDSALICETLEGEGLDEVEVSYIQP